MTWRIDEYRTAAGETPVRTFIAGLPPDAKAEAVALIKLAEALGNSSENRTRRPLGTGCLSCAGTRSGSSTCSSPARPSGFSAAW